MPKSALPPHLRNAKHWDYPSLFKWVPRAWTSFDLGKPKKILGNQKSVRAGAPAPIGEPNSWQFSIFPKAPWYLKPIAWYFCFSGSRKNGKARHFRIGARYDDVDKYTTFPTIACRKYAMPSR